MEDSEQSDLASLEVRQIMTCAQSESILDNINKNQSFSSVSCCFLKVQE